MVKSEEHLIAVGNACDSYTDNHTVEASIQPCNQHVSAIKALAHFIDTPEEELGIQKMIPKQKILRFNGIAMDIPNNVVIR